MIINWNMCPGKYYPRWQSTVILKIFRFFIRLSMPIIYENISRNGICIDVDCILVIFEEGRSDPSIENIRGKNLEMVFIFVGIARKMHESRWTNNNCVINFQDGGSESREPSSLGSSAGSVFCNLERDYARVSVFDPIQCKPRFAVSVYSLKYRPSSGTRWNRCSPFIVLVSYPSRFHGNYSQFNWDIMTIFYRKLGTIVRHTFMTHNGSHRIFKTTFLQLALVLNEQYIYIYFYCHYFFVFSFVQIINDMRSNEALAAYETEYARLFETLYEARRNEDDLMEKCRNLQVKRFVDPLKTVYYVFYSIFFIIITMLPRWRSCENDFHINCCFANFTLINWIFFLHQDEVIEKTSRSYELEKTVESQEETITRLKYDIVETSKLADAAHTREQNAQEVIENLRLTNTKLNHELEQKNKQLAMDEE